MINVWAYIICYVYIDSSHNSNPSYITRTSLTAEETLEIGIVYSVNVDIL